MTVAAYAAPNPLSMFTTTTPGAHELSIARRAAMPPKDAPVPDGSRDRDDRPVNESADHTG